MVTKLISDLLSTLNCDVSIFTDYYGIKVTNKIIIVTAIIIIIIIIIIAIIVVLVIIGRIRFSSVSLGPRSNHGSLALM